MKLTAGWKARGNLFRKNCRGGAEFRPEGATFIGPFVHDLSNIQKAMPPGTKISFSLKRTSDTFFLMKNKDDPEVYKVIVSNCVLYVKVAKMSDIIYKQIEARFTQKPITYQFRKFIVKPINVPFHNQNFVSGNLFPDSEAPDKILFALVHTNSFNGDMTKNPFQFPRKYEISKDADKGTVEGMIESAYYKRKIAQLEKEQKLRDVQFFKLMNLFKDEFKNLRDKNSSEPSCNSNVASGSKGSAGSKVTPRTLRSRKGKASPKNTKNSKIKNPTFKKPRTTRDSSEDSESFRDCVGPDDGDEDYEEEEEDEDDEGEDEDEDVEEESNLDRIREGLGNLGGPPITIYVKNFELEINSATIDQVIYLNYKINYFF